jgi:hypothetical protein
MAERDIAQTEASDLSGAITDYSVDTKTTDGASDVKETNWTNDNWTQQLGYYKQIPEIKATIDAKATWTVGKGTTGNPTATLLMGIIKGNGIDTFNTILENMIRTYHIGGDAFAEIIKSKGGKVVNLKPLDPQTMTIVANQKGLIIRYEQNSKVKGKKPHKFKPEQIFHLSRNRVADEMHGQSLIDALEWIIKAKNEVMENQKIIMQRFVKPLMIFHLDTDDSTEIASYKAKMDAAYANGENMYVPKGAVVPELVGVAPNATLNPLAWLQYLDDKFTQASGVPDIILGGSKALTEASSKIAYLAFQQTIEEEQLYIEETVAYQLGLTIELEFPASLENELISDKQKDATSGAAQPEETNVSPEVPV